MTQINILGEDVKIAFNMAVEIAYEQLTGQVFDLEAISKSMTMGTVKLAFACIIANNPDTTITLDNILYDITPAEMKMLTETYVREMREWLQIPDVVAADEQAEAALRSQEEEEEDGQKN